MEESLQSCTWTINLVRHLKTHHWTEHAQIQGKQQDNILLRANIKAAISFTTCASTSKVSLMSWLVSRLVRKLAEQETIFM